MIFKTNHIYHIFNQGNNRDKIFFEEKNYVFFKEKIREHVLPYADVLAWCMMPNHFHLMVYVKDSPSATQSRARTATIESPARTGLSDNNAFNKSIGIMLASYTRAINKQEGRSGSLFRQETKAICLTNNERISPSWFNTSGGALINIKDLEKQYPKICFDYIHGNPVKDGLVCNAYEWQHSSVIEYLGDVQQPLICVERAREFGLI